MPTVPPTEAAAKDIWSVFSDGYTSSPKESWDDLVDQKRRTLTPIRQQKWTGPCKHKQKAFIAAPPWWWTRLTVFPGSNHPNLPVPPKKQPSMHLLVRVWGVAMMDNSC
eukprot:g17731.t1